MERLNKKNQVELNIQDNLNNTPSLEAKRIKETIKRTDTETFRLFGRLMGIQIMLEKAVVIYK